MRKTREQVYDELTMKFVRVDHGLQTAEMKQELDGLLWDLAMELVSVEVTA
jgi:hypothetical protein